MLRSLKRIWSEWSDRRRVRHLQNFRFEKVWKGIELDRFYEFLKRSAVPAGGFLVTYEFDEGGLAWFYFLVDRTQTSDSEVHFASLEIALPDDADCRECPEEWRGFPVYRFPD